MRVRLALAVAVVAILSLSSPAQGVVPDDRGRDADRSRSTEFTEANDWDGVGDDIPDEGDNRHPSGRDRSVEPGGSENQGRAKSAPDENGRGPERNMGGTDKPNGPGGEDVYDQDGNNGCGNDDDFEDDNEGWCGRKRPQASPTSFPTEVPLLAAAVAPSPIEQLAEAPLDQLPEAVEAAAGGLSVMATSLRLWAEGIEVGDLVHAEASSPTLVLSAVWAASPADVRPEGQPLGGEGMRLPMTGIAFTPLLMLSLLLLTIGGLMRGRGRSGV